MRLLDINPSIHHLNRSVTKPLKGYFIQISTALCFLLAMINSNVHAQTLSEPESSEFFLESDNGQRQAALLLSTDVVMHIEGMTNRVVVKQAFINNTDAWRTGTYVFPLPEDSAVNEMRMLLSDREIIGEIHEKSEARQIYQAAKVAGRKAALVEQQRPNMFTQKVANIAPGETITVEIQYIQAIRYDGGRFSLRFPMTITPRFIPGASLSGMIVRQELASTQEGWVTSINTVTDENEISPPYLPVGQTNLVNLTITLNAGLPLTVVRSSSHELDIVETAGIENQFHLSFSSGTQQMNRDFELEWFPQSESAPLAASFADQIDETTYLQIMVLPPQVEEQSFSLVREFIIVLDTSGSMAGSSIVAAKRSVELALGRLKSNDRFNVVEFNSSFQSIFSSSVPATPQNIQAALQFVRGLDADGGTNMAPALNYVLAPATNSGQNESAIKQVVFITDGSVGNETELFRLIKQQIGEVRLFTVGIGSAPNSYFMRKSAEVGRGTFTYISDLKQISEKMDGLFRKLENPAVTDLTIHWPAGTEVEFYPAVVPDLYLGEPLFVTAKISGMSTVTPVVTVTGTVAGQSWQKQLTLAPSTNTEAISLTDSGLASYWARQKMAGLLDSLNLGEDREQIKTQVLAIALPFQLLSPFSSFVAVENKISRPENTDLLANAVANEMALGQKNGQKTSQLVQQINYPHTATAAQLHFVMGLLALILLLALTVFSGRNGELNSES